MKINISIFVSSNWIRFFLEENEKEEGEDGIPV